MHRSRYPRFVCKNSIEKLEDYEGERLFKISFIINARATKKILVISRAPKPWDEDRCNLMLQRVLKFIYNKKEYIGDIYSITLVNLFTVIEYDKNSVEEIMSLKGELFVEGNDGLLVDGIIIKNDEIIKDEISQSNMIFLAWGEGSKAIENIYQDRIESILMMIRKVSGYCIYCKDVYVVGELTSKGYPRHCMKWKVGDNLNNFQFI